MPDDQPDLFGESLPRSPAASAPRPASSRASARAAFSASAQPSRPSAAQPLAARMRPRALAEIVGQEHLTAPGALLPRLISSNRFGSLIFYGPPGCGKTSFAEVIARETGSRFVRINAVMSNVAELREILADARRLPETPTLLFIDELHRFNKSQQDLLLPDVEEGYIRLIGATTHNPGFYVNPPLLSRSHLFRLEPLSTAAIASVLRRALADTERGLGSHGATASDAVLADLAVLCDGDLRRALNSLEVIVLSMPNAMPAAAMPAAASGGDAANAGGSGDEKIPNPNNQIPKKSQIPTTKSQTGSGEDNGGTAATQTAAATTQTTAAATATTAAGAAAGAAAVQSAIHNPQSTFKEITPADLEAFARERRIRYDADEDEHYDTISVFIKSCRGSDPDAALYWLAKMLAGGEDPRFIARRLVILASEDVGLADPLALPTAVAAHHACDFVGLPECEYALAHATLYIACANKSNSAATALFEAKRAVSGNTIQKVPLPFRDKGGQASKRAGHGKGYLYSHDFPENISGQDYLEKPLTLYTPKTLGMEARIAERLARWRELRAAIQTENKRKA
jgi:putative ATPase